MKSLQSQGGTGRPDRGRFEPPRRGRRRQGVALLTALGVLFLLFVLGISFMQVMSLERAAAANHGLEARVDLIAKAGVAEGVEIARRYTRIFGVPNAEHPFFIPGPLDSGGNNSSFFRALGGTFIESGDHYETIVIDSSAQINVNDRIGPEDGTGGTMRSMLLALGEAIAERQSVPNPLTAADVTAILRARDAQPGRRFAAKDAILEALPDSADKLARYDRFRDYVSVSSWQDRVMAPGEAVGQLPRSYETVGAEPNPAYRGIGLASRAPVDINLAPAEVLEALVRGLAATGYEIKSTGTRRRSGDIAEIVRHDVAPITKEQARAFADAVIETRRADNFIDGAEELEALAFGLEGTAPDRMSRGQIKALLANADPNARLFGVMPNDPLLLLPETNKASRIFVEKAGLSYAVAGSTDRLRSGTTEFCFAPTGVFEVRTIARIIHGGVVIVDGDGVIVVGEGEVIDGEAVIPPEILVEEVRASTVEVFVTQRHSTQLDFNRAYQLATANVTGAPTLADARDARGMRFLTYPEAVGRAPSPFDGNVQMAVPSARLMQARFGGKRIVTAFDGSVDAVDSSGNPLASSVDTRETGSVTASASVNDNGDFGPDGMICWRGQSVDDVVALPTGAAADNLDTPPTGDAGPVNVGEGGLEFWVRLLTDGDLGSDETLVHLVRRGPVNPTIAGSTRRNVEAAGLAVRIERHGKELIANLFYWGLPEGSMPPENMIRRNPLPNESGTTAEFDIIPPVMTERVANIESWRAGEWHHVALSWRNLTEANFFVDGEGVGGPDPVTPSVQRTVEITRGQGERQVTETITGFGGGELTIVRTIRDPDRRRTTYTGDVNLFKLASQQFRSQRLFVGGIRDQVDSREFIDVGNLGFIATPAGEIQRLPNAVLDDLVVYADPTELDAAAQTRPARYDLFDRGGLGRHSAFTGAFPIPQIEGVTGLPVFEMGPVYFTLRRPASWSGENTSLGVTFGVDATGVVSNEGVLGALQEVGSGEVPIAPRIDLRTNTNRRLLYQVQFINANDQATRNVSPILDDVTVTLFPSTPRVLSTVVE